MEFLYILEKKDRPHRFADSMSYKFILDRTKKEIIAWASADHEASQRY